MSKVDRGPRLAEVGTRVRNRRRELGMTQEQLAEATGISKSFVSEVEAGQTAASGLNYLRIAEALDANVQWLLTGQEDDEPRRASVGPTISPLVSDLAESEQWSHRHTMEINAALQAIVGRRTRDGKRWEPTRELVLSIHKALEQADKGDGR